MIAGAAARKGLPQNAVLFLKTGVCGGLYDIFHLFAGSIQSAGAGQIKMSVLYIALSVVFCLAGVAAGMYAAEHIV